MSAAVLPQKYETVRLDKIEPHPDNPRRGNVEIIRESIDANGFYGALVVQRSTGRILAGNHRYQAALAAGLDKLPALVVDVDDDTARRILLIDNRSNDLASYDEAALAAVLVSIDDLAGSGYSQDDLALLQAKLNEKPSPDDAVDEVEGRDDSDKLDAGYHVLIKCESEQQQADLLDRFIGEGLTCKALVV